MDANPINAGDTAWVLASAALVLLMTPGLAFFYGGMVRRKNVLGILMQCFILMCVISVQWVLFGYSLAFGEGGAMNSFIGGLGWAGLQTVGQAPSASYGTTIPHVLFMAFQGMFAVITPALIIGAIAERMKFAGFVIFMLLWATLVYDPICHMVWAIGGYLAAMGALDFAGGTVVHINAGVAGLVIALLLGKRLGYERKPMAIHNMPFVVMGAGLLWFGWFGFNSGSALAANGLAAHAFVTTNVAAAAAGLSWALIEWKTSGKPTMFGVVTGIVAGLVAITPAAGFVDVMGALIIGLTVSFVCFFAVGFIKVKLGYDDSLDAFGVHGIGGIWGALMTGVFANPTVNSLGTGLLHGNPKQLWIQFVAVLVTVVYCAVVTAILYKIVDVIVGMRVSADDEVIGLDLSQHHERAYTIFE